MKSHRAEEEKEEVSAARWWWDGARLAWFGVAMGHLVVVLWFGLVGRELVGIEMCMECELDAVRLGLGFDGVRVRVGFRVWCCLE